MIALGVAEVVGPEVKNQLCHGGGMSGSAVAIFQFRDAFVRKQKKKRKEKKKAAHSVRQKNTTW